MDGGSDEGFFEEDESPERVAELAAKFAGPRRFTPAGELLEAVQTLRRQSERLVREGIVSELEERLRHLRKSAVRLEAGRWTVLTPCAVRGRLEEASYCLWVARGFPGRGVSFGPWELSYPLPGHSVTLRGYPAGRRPEGHTVACPCFPRPGYAAGLRDDEWGWSPTVIGAKRLARRHAGLM